MRKTIRCLLSMALVAVMILTCTMFAFAAEDSGSEAGVALNTATETTYDDVTEALAAASEGDTITLHQDASAMLVSVTNGVTLDLNGHTLEASYVTCFGDIVDNCKDGNGLLKVAEKRFLIQNRNEQLPIKAESGYTFVEVEKFNTAYQSEKSRYAFQPFIAAKGHELLAGGFDATGVTVNVRVSWNQGDGNRYQDFVYNDQMVTKFLSSYSAAGNKYGQMFTLVLNGAENFEQLTYEAVVTSETGVEIVSQPTVVLNKDGNVETDENNQVTEDLTIENGEASATVAAGTQLDAGAKNLELSVKEMDVTTGDIELEDTEEIISVDVHVDGVSKDNTVPIIVTLKEFAPEYMNKGNINLYHVEGDQTVKMTRVYSLNEVDEHNEFYYDTLTGTVTMALASFSEVATTYDTEKKWEGKFDYTWYSADAKELTIANADQLAAFGAIVGSMNGKTQDSFAGKTVKLLADINLGDSETENNPDVIFYPIGYYNSTGSYKKVSGGSATSSVSSFEGTFDGNGHTVSNFYQNTWEMFGDYNSGYSGTPNHYKDAMGLFGYVLNGTVKNLTVDNFSSDGEYTPTGVIAAYADGNSTFENIAITDCNPRVYNTGNGGIIGIAGDTSAANDDHITLKNITVDNSNKISALWGSWDVACGGLVGMYRGNVDGSGNATGDTISFENCHVSAIIDVYNDVCANYQYYAYRYAGMIIGSVRHNTTNAEGKTIPNMAGISATGCTVNYGDWNDYYYCEFEKNSLASYSEDYQFSRVDKSEIAFDENGKVTGCTHSHTDAEDKRAVYLPFHQLFTGYSWGVSSIGLKEYSGIVTDLGITEGDQQESVYKFGKANTAKDKYITGTEITIGELFEAINLENPNLAIKSKNVQVTISPVGDDSTAGGEYAPAEADSNDNVDWTEGTLKFNGKGEATIAISDYYFCKTTVIKVEIYQPENVEKFTYNGDEAKDKYITGTQIAIGKLFEAINIEDPNLAIKSENVTVTISSVGDESSAYGTYDANNVDWTQGTLTFDGTGMAKITITDGHFCIPTTIDVEVVSADKIVSKFDHSEKYTYRVGNCNAFKVGSLFKTIEDGMTLNDVAVTVNTLNGTRSNNYTLELNENDWTQSTVEFAKTFTGPVEVSITATNVTPLTIKLEVVDAINATSATNATKNNVVLLNDCGFSSLEVSGGYTLYGNGFTMTCGSDSAALDMGYSFVTLNNGTLDNVQVVCPNFDYAVLYKSNMTESGNRSETTDRTRYFNVKSGVMVSGNSQILNSRISGARAAVNVSGGNLLIDNSRIELGAVASLLVGAANSVTLRDVTLVQKPTASTYDSSKTLMGFSTLFVCDSNGNAAPVTIEGTLVQNAWVNESDKKYVPSDGEGIIEKVLEKTEHLHDLDGDGINESLNLGFAYMPESLTSKVNIATITDNRTNKIDVPYDYAEVSILTGKTYVYSYKNTNGTADNFKTESLYVPNKYSDVITVNYSDTSDGLTTGKSYGADGWVYELNVDLDKLPGYKLDFSKLSMLVNGAAVTDYKVDGNAKPTSPVDVTAGGVTYTLSATVNGKECTATYKVTGTETSKESPSLVASNYAAGLCVASSYGGTWSGAAPALEGIQIKYWSVAEKQYKTISLSECTPTDKKGQINGTNNTWTYSPANGDFTLTVTGGQVHSSNKVNAMPVCVENNGKYTLYFVAAKSNGLVNSGNSARTIPVSYTFKDNNNGDVLSFSHTWSVAENKDLQYNYSDFCSGDLTQLEKKDSTTSCLAEGTLITMSDGSKRKVEDLRKGDSVMSFNHITGEIENNDVIIVVKTESEHYENTFVFDDGSQLLTINGHGVYDLNEKKYVDISHENAETFIGHEFVSVKPDGSISTKKLVDVASEYKSGYKYDIVTEGILNYVAEDTLSVTHVLVDVINSFDFDDSMLYDAEKMQTDIDKYGLYTYDEWEAYADKSVFEQYNIPIMKVGIEKGLYTKEYIIDLINTYVLDDSVQLLDN